MYPSIRRFFQRSPVLRELYGRARKRYQRSRIARIAARHFANPDEYLAALELEDGKTVEVRMKDGLAMTIRRNYMDAAILAEIFVDDCYVQGLSLPPQPLVVDIGGYIGDFALYAAKRLRGRKVVVCEPSPHNWTLLQENVARNHFEDRIVMVNKAVTTGGDVLMNVDAPDGAQARVTAYGNGREKKWVPGITLAELVAEHGLTTIDLLKIDCEGGEYDILLSASESLLASIQNIVFEYHEIEDYGEKLEAVRQRLHAHGFELTLRGCLVSASRP